MSWSLQRRRRRAARGTPARVEPLERRRLLASDGPLRDVSGGGRPVAEGIAADAHQPPAAQSAAPNIAITSLRLCDADGNPIASVVTGQEVFLRADWVTTGSASDHYYFVRYTIDGVTVDGGNVFEREVLPLILVPQDPPQLDEIVQQR